MAIETIDQPTDAQEPQSHGCKCEAQIADILQRLETLERDALTVEKLRANRGPAIAEIMEAYARSRKEYPTNELLEAAAKRGEIACLKDKHHPQA